MSTILRLIISKKCNRSCEGCCNKDFNISALPIIKDYTPYNKIILTGGEPLLNIELILKTIKEIRKQTNTLLYVPIYIYTAKSKPAKDILYLLHWIDGLTLTLHEQFDVKAFSLLNDELKKNRLIYHSFRLNIFKGLDTNNIDLSLWKVKKDIEWIKDCPLPPNETLMRL